MLRENVVLKYLNIDGIKIGDTGAANIADALCVNETLLVIHMVRTLVAVYASCVGKIR